MNIARRAVPVLIAMAAWGAAARLDAASSSAANCWIPGDREPCPPSWTDPQNQQRICDLWPPNQQSFRPTVRQATNGTPAYTGRTEARCVSAAEHANCKYDCHDGQDPFPPRCEQGAEPDPTAYACPTTNSSARATLSGGMPSARNLPRPVPSRVPRQAGPKR